MFLKDRVKKAKKLYKKYALTDICIISMNEIFKDDAVNAKVSMLNFFNCHLVNNYSILCILKNDGWLTDNFYINLTFYVMINFTKL